MKKILVVMLASSVKRLYERSGGGVDSVCQVLLGEIIRKDQDCRYRVVAFNPFNDYVCQGEEKQLADHVSVIMYNHRPWRGIPSFVSQNLIVLREAIRFRPDVIHCHLAAMLAFPFPKTRTVLTLHGYKKICRQSEGFLNDFLYEKVLEPTGIRNADVVTTVSKEIVRECRNDFGKNVLLIKNPIASRFFQDRGARQERDYYHIVTAGAVIPRKRTLDCIKAVRMAAESFPGKELRLTVCGPVQRESPYFLEIERYLSEHGLASRVDFLGQTNMDRLLETFRGADCGLFLSAEETFGLVPLEMAAAGLPLVATRVGVVEECADDFAGRGMRIVEVGDVQSAAEFVVEALQGRQRQNPELRAYIRDAFHQESVYREILSTYGP